MSFPFLVGAQNRNNLHVFTEMVKVETLQEAIKIESNYTNKYKFDNQIIVAIFMNQNDYEKISGIKKKKKL